MLLSHDEPNRIGQPPNSELTNERIASTPSASTALSLTQDSYNRRAFVTASGSSVCCEGDPDNISIEQSH